MVALIEKLQNNGNDFLIIENIANVMDKIDDVGMLNIVRGIDIRYSIILMALVSERKTVSRLKKLILDVNATIKSDLTITLESEIHRCKDCHTDHLGYKIVGLSRKSPNDPISILSYAVSAALNSIRSPILVKRGCLKYMDGSGCNLHTSVYIAHLPVIMDIKISAERTDTSFDILDVISKVGIVINFKSLDMSSNYADVEPNVELWRKMFVVLGKSARIDSVKVGGIGKEPKKGAEKYFKNLTLILTDAFLHCNFNRNLVKDEMLTEIFVSIQDKVPGLEKLIKTSILKSI